MSISQPLDTSHSHSARPVIGVLLVHGFNGSRGDMAELQGILNAHDIVTVNMLLPGHGQRVQALFSVGWEDWVQAVRHELNLLKERCDIVFLVGHSLGGALILHIAAHEEVAGVVSMCAPLHMNAWLKPAISFAKYVIPLVPVIREDVHDPEARRRSIRDVYSWMPMRPIESMLQFLPQLRTELPQITVPALIMTSIHDHVVPARDGREIYRLIGSREKHLVTLHRSYHVIVRDYDRQEVFDKTLSFVQRHARIAESYEEEKSSAHQTA